MPFIQEESNSRLAVRETHASLFSLYFRPSNIPDVHDLSAVFAYIALDDSVLNKPILDWHIGVLCK